MGATVPLERMTIVFGKTWVLRVPQMMAIGSQKSMIKTGIWALNFLQVDIFLAGELQ